MKNPIGLAVVLPVIFSGCASIVYVPPEPYDVTRTIDLNEPYDMAWSKTISWFADNNIKIGLIDKQSGLIQSVSDLKSMPGVLDCGYFKYSYGGVVYVSKIESVDVNVTVRKVDENTSRLRANVFGYFQANVLGQRDVSSFDSGRCESTGTLEEGILEYIINY